MTFRHLALLLAIIALACTSVLAGSQATSIYDRPETQWDWLAEIEAIPGEGYVQGTRELHIYLHGELVATITPTQVASGAGSELDMGELGLNESPLLQMPLLWSDHFYIGSLDLAGGKAQTDPLEGASVAFVRITDPTAIGPGQIELRDGEVFAYDAASGVGVVFYGLDDASSRDLRIELIGVLQEGMVSVGLEATQQLPGPLSIRQGAPAPASGVPEPASVALLLAGGAVLVNRKRT